jgi:hypothetical protein
MNEKCCKLMFNILYYRIRRQNAVMNRPYCGFNLKTGGPEPVGFTLSGSARGVLS